MKMLEKQKKIFEGAVAKGYFLGVTDAEGELVLAATNNVEAVVGAVEGAGEVDVWVYDEEGCFGHLEFTGALLTANDAHEVLRGLIIESSY